MELHFNDGEQFVTIENSADGCIGGIDDAAFSIK